MAHRTASGWAADDGAPTAQSAPAFCVAHPCARPTARAVVRVTNLLKELAVSSSAFGTQCRREGLGFGEGGLGFRKRAVLLGMTLQALDQGVVTLGDFVLDA